MKNLKYAKIEVNLLNYNTILTSAPINRLFLPIPDYADCSNNRPDYAYGRLIGTALISYSLCRVSKQLFHYPIKHGSYTSTAPSNAVSSNVCYLYHYIKFLNESMMSVCKIISANAEQLYASSA